jgi:hypothetical protein
VVNPDADRCPSCGRAFGSGSLLPSLPLGSVLALIGGLALATAYFMPWFGAQGLLLSGQFLSRFLSSPADGQRFMPGLASNPSELQQLRTLIYLFPICGVVATVVALAHGLRGGRPGWLGLLLATSGAVPLVALVIGLSRLPPGSTSEVGIWQMGIGAVAVVSGAVVSYLFSR